ncbi:MAG: hypothetical protein JNL50_05430 [Phycisphaerae bacterium]|nr:hypothetical protein [Phycisphaerae bacterium]
MPRLGALRRVEPGARVAALDALMHTCAPDERAAVASELLELAALEETARRWPWQKPTAPVAARALVAIAGAWELWPDELRSVALSIGRERWAALLPGAMTSMSTVARRGVTRLVAENLIEPIGVLAPLALTLTDPTSAAQLERAMLSASFAAAGLDPDTGEVVGAEDVGARAWLERIVAGACESFHRHQCRRVLLAAAVLLNTRDLREAALDGSSALELSDGEAFDAGRRRTGVSPLARWFVSLDAGGLAPLAAMIRSARHPLVRLRAWEWSAIPALSAACAERLARAGTPAEHEAVLSRWHLLLNPRRVAAPLLPDAKDLAGLSSDARAGAARLSPGALGRDEARALLWPLLGDPDSLVRHAAAMAGGPSELADFSFDADTAIASSAARRWSLVGLRSGQGSLLLRAVESDDGTRRRLASRLARAPAAAVRRVARQDLAAYDWSVDCSSRGRLAARHMLERDPGGTVRRLEEELGSPEVWRRLGAIGVIRALSLHESFAGTLVAIAREATPAEPHAEPTATPGAKPGETPAEPDARRAGSRLRATAVSALGDGPMLAPGASRDAERVIEECLHDADTRVRANAVEAVARRVRHSPQSSDHALLTLLELKDDGAHRARANALRGLLEVAAGEPSADGVRAMLSDERPMHRLAGVWLAGRVLPGVKAAIASRYRELAGVVRGLADTDQDEHVRRRATHAAALMSGGAA